MNVTALLLQASNEVDASQLLRDGSLSLLARATGIVFTINTNIVFMASYLLSTQFRC